MFGTLEHGLLTVTWCCREGDGALEQLQKEVQQWQAACERAQSALQTSQQVGPWPLDPRITSLAVQQEDSPGKGVI